MITNISNAIVMVGTTFPDGSGRIGSGIMVGVNEVLTVAHLLAKNGVAATGVQISALHGSILDMEGKGAVHVDVNAAPAKSLDNSINYEKWSAQDMGGVQLSFPLGLQTGWLDLDSTFVSGPVTISGFPVSNGKQVFEQVTGLYSDSPQNHGAGTVSSVTPATLRSGYSGGAVTNVDGKVVGVQSAANPDWAVVADITPENKVSILGWSANPSSSVTYGIEKAEVTKVFEIGFGREPNANELKYWTGQLDSGALSLVDAYALAVTVPSVQISLLYDTLVNRPAKSSELNFWVPEIQKEGSLHGLENAILTSGEFLSSRGAQNTPAFVDQTAMNILGHTIAGVERDYWINKVGHDGVLSVLDAVSTNPEFNATHLEIMGNINPLGEGAYVQF